MRPQAWLLFGFCTAIAVAHAAPDAVRASYRISLGGIQVGQVSDSFVRDGATYRIVSETRSDGFLKWFTNDRLTVSSEGRISAAGLVPLKYEFARQSDGARAVRASFDWGGGVLHSEHDGKYEVVPLHDGTQDRLSILYQFMFSRPVAPEVKAWMTNGKKVEQYVYRKHDDTTIETPAGNFRVAHYVRDAKPDEDKAQLWLATDRDFLPVRIVFEDRNGSSLEQTLVSLSVQ